MVRHCMYCAQVTDSLRTQQTRVDDSDCLGVSCQYNSGLNVRQQDSRVVNVCLVVFGQILPVCSKARSSFSFMQQKVDE